MSRLSVAILAGGLATRLGKVASTTPKSLVNIAGRPFLHHQLELLREQGVVKVVLCIGHLGEQILESVGDGSSFGLRVTYSTDGARLKGTAGAIKQALPLLSDPFFVLYGDSFLACDFQAVQQSYEVAGTLSLMTVFHNDGRWDASNVEYKDGVIVAYDKVRHSDKMRHIDYGLGVFDHRAFADVAEFGSCDLATIYQSLLVRNELAGHEVSERFHEIGSVAGLEETRRYLSERNRVEATPSERS
jgi:NDP-sugar pyrophosphorylase family protein